MEQNRGNIHVENKDDVIDLGELFLYLKSKIILIIIVLLMGSIGAGLFTQFFITPEYTAAAKLYIVSSAGKNIVNLEDLNLGSKLSADYKELLKTRPICNEVIRELGLNYTYNEFTDMITIEEVTDTRILVITVKSTKPEEAKDIANVLADKAVTYLPKMMDTTSPNIVEEAIAPQIQSSPILAKNVVLGGILALIAVIGILTMLFVTDDTVKTSEDIEKLIGVMPLTVVPESIEKDKQGRRRKEYRYE